MALPRIRENLDGLPADVAKEYKEVDGKFVLDIEGDSLDPLINAKNHEKTARQIAEQKLQQAQEQLDEMRRGNIPKADVEALEGSWKSKLTEATTKAKEREAKLLQQVHGLTIGNTAAQIAAEISTAPDLMRGEIERRLAVEETEDGRVVVRVKGADGKPSALTLDEFKNELKGDKRYAPIIIGSKASGGGANGGQNGGGGIPSGKKPHEMSSEERLEFYKRDPEGFAQAFGQV